VSRQEKSLDGLLRLSPRFHLSGIAVVPLASCQRIAFSFCITASGFEKFIARIVLLRARSSRSLVDEATAEILVVDRKGRLRARSSE